MCDAFTSFVVNMLWHFNIPALNIKLMSHASPACFYLPPPSCRSRPVPPCRWRSPCPASASASSSWWPPWWLLGVSVLRSLENEVLLFVTGKSCCRCSEEDTSQEPSQGWQGAQLADAERRELGASEHRRGGCRLRVGGAVCDLNLTGGLETALVPSDSPFPPVTPFATPHFGSSRTYCCPPPHP